MDRWHAGASAGAGVSGRALILGANGQLGVRLTAALGERCVGLNRAQCDLTTLDETTAARLIDTHQPHLIFLTAAYTAVDAAERARELAMQVNAHAPGVLARAAAVAKVPLVYCSTDYVFDGAHGPYREDALCNPLNVYGLSKWRGENAVQEAAGVHYIFRLQWLYDTRGVNFLRSMQRLLTERPSLRVVADQWGAPTPAPAVAQALAQAMPAMRDGSLPSGIYHLACAGFTSWHGFACAIAQRMGSPASVVPILSREFEAAATRPADARLDCATLATHGVVLPHWRAAFDTLMEE